MLQSITAKTGAQTADPQAPAPSAPTAAANGHAAAPIFRAATSSTGTLTTPAELAERFGLKAQSANGATEWHGANPFEAGATRDGFILNSDGSAFDRKINRRYTSRAVAELSDIAPADYQPCADFRARNGHANSAQFANGHSAPPPKQAPKQGKAQGKAQGKPVKTPEQRGLTPDTLQAFGVRKTRDGWEYPTHHANGEPGRARLKSKMSAPRKYLWQGEGERPAGYALDKLNGAREVWLVGGEPDVWTCYQAGIPAVSTFGEGQGHDALAAQLAALGVLRVRIALDADEAGRKGTLAMLGACRRAGIEADARQLDGPDGETPEGFDVCDLFAACDFDGDRLQKELAAARPFDFKSSDPSRAAIPAPGLTNERGQSEYTARQIVEIVRPAWDADALTTHAAHAARVGEILGGDVRFCPELGWLGFDGRQWNKDDRHNTATAARAVKLSAQVREESALLFETAGRLAKAGRAADAEAMSRAASALLKHAKQTEAKTFVEGALHFAAGDGALRVAAAAFDQRPWLIGFQNGVWDSGQWREHRREDYLMHLSPAALDFNADRSEWLTVLERLTGGDADFARTLQDTAGYILSGASHLRFLPWPYGPKGTGKSTFAELLHTVLGGMAASIDPKKLQADSARERLGADLWNRRLAIVGEAGSQRLEAELLKTLSGSDALSVRFLYREAFDAPPRHVLLMVSNDAPRLDAYDDALRDRVVALPFVHRLDAPDPLRLTGGARIEAVRQDPASPLVRGFAAWAVEGLARVFETQSIFRAPCIGVATARFWADTDPLTAFWEEVPAEELRDGITKTELRNRYEKWCQIEGARPTPPRQWARACESHGLKEERRGGGVRFWFSLAVTQVTEVGLFPQSPRETIKATYGLSGNDPTSVTCVTKDAGALDLTGGEL